MIPNSTEITLTVTLDDANLILAGLQELPAKLANPLTQRLQEQARAQLTPPAPETPPAAE